MPLARYWRVKIYVPVADPRHQVSLETIIRGTSTNVQTVLKAIWRVPGIGKVGNYEQLYELDFGFEGYRAAKGADPRYGAIGETTKLGKAAIVTYMACESNDNGQQNLDRLISEIRKVHPWEHPVIEFTECLLYLPVKGNTSDPDHDT
jgi:hypothetical protein